MYRVFQRFTACKLGRAAGLIFLLFLCPLTLEGQELTRVAVLDYDRIFEYFPRQGRNLKQIEQLRERVEKTMQNLQVQLDQLEEELTEAQTEGDTFRISLLENQIKQKKAYGRNYLDTQNRIVENLKRSGLQSSGPEFQEMLKNVVQLVAREQGYSIILDKASRSLIWFETSIDITETVVQQLRGQLETGIE